MIKIKKLTLKGFRSFLEPATIEFNDDGFYLISGTDKITGGSNGSGKSSIFYAIAWALDFNDIPTTQLKNPNSQTIEVILTLDKDGNSYEIHKTSNKLEVSENGVKLLGMKEELKKKVDSILENSTIFEMLSFRKQGDKGVFFEMTDSKMKTFLSECIEGLSKVEEELVKSNKKVSELTNAIDAQASLEALRTQDIEHSDLTKDLRDKELILEEVSNLNSRLVSLDDTVYVDKEDSVKIDYIKKNVETLNLQQNLKIIELKEVQQAKKDLGIQIYTLQQTEKKQALGVARLRQIFQDIKKIESNIKHLESNKCPNCLQDWNKSQDQVVVLRRSLDQLLKESDDIKGGINDNPDLQNKIQENAENLANIDKREREILSETYSIHSSILLDEKQVQTLLTYRQEKINQEKLTIKREVSSKKTILGFIEDKIKKFNDLKIKIVAIRTKTQELKEELELESNVGLTYKEVLNNIFDGFLSEMEYETNKMLSQIPNTSDISVSLSSVKENKNGSIKQEISTKIYKSGHEISFKTLSGGQKCSLSLSADLAMIEAIKRRTKVKPGWLALDEALDGMDVNSKESAIECIKKYAEGQLVLMVDHSTEIKESFNGIINVEFDGTTSKIVV